MQGSLALLLLGAVPILAQTAAQPAITAVGNAANGAGVSPGSLISIYGANLSQTAAIAQPGADGAYPATLQGVEVRIAGRHAALLYVSAEQINAQVPYDLAPGALDLVVTSGTGTASARITIVGEEPAVFPGGIVRNGTFVPPSGSDPARSGDVLVVFCTGLGAVNPPVPSGRVAPVKPFSYTVRQPAVSMGGRDADVIYSILAPGYLGVYQVAIRVPEGLSAGEVALVVSIGDVRSRPGQVAVAGGGTNAPPRIGPVRSSALSKTGDRYVTGSVVRIDIAEESGESDIASGSIRITSESQSYDSGAQPLTLHPIFYQWNTAGLNPAADYKVTVSLTDRAGQSSTDDSLRLGLTPNQPSIRRLVDRVDLSLPSPGIPLFLARAYVLDSGFDGPLGYGWSHNYLMNLVETPDGLVKVFNTDGSGSFFQTAGGGSYTGRIGDRRSLFKGADGAFLLREKSGGSYVFDSAGRLREILDRNRNAVRLSYDASGRLTTVDGASGQWLAFTYGSDQRVSAVADSAGRRVQYSYDPAGNLVSFTDIGGNQTAYSYDDRHAMTSVTDAAGKRVTFVADAERRLLEMAAEGGEGKVTFSYDPVLPQVTATDASGKQSLTTYDNHGFPVSARDAQGNTTTTEYDAAGNPVAITDANGNRTEFSYDASGDLVAVTNASGHRIAYAYDPVFHLPVTVTDSAGRTTTYEYDSNGNRTATIYPDGSAEVFTYDTNGNLAARTDRMGRTIRFAYDGKGQLVGKILPDGTQDVFAYDASGNMVSAAGRNGAIRFAYDSAGRTTRVEQPGGTVTYAYDALGNRTRLTYPDGTLVEYGYDRLNRLEQLKRNGKVLAAYQYDASGRVLHRTLANGTRSTMEYDPVGRLAAIVNLKPTAEVLSRFSYTHDAAGNRITMTTLEGTTQYFYDALHRLTRVIQPNGDTTEYRLDTEGNRLSVAAGQAATDYATNSLNQYTKVGDDAYGYDRNGNLVSKRTAEGTTTYDYDFENRLVRATGPNGAVEFTYDALGERVSKRAGAATLRYVYDGLHLIAEYDHSGGLNANYYYGSTLDEVLAMTRQGRDYYYSQDGLGSTANLSDEHGNPVDSHSYDVYGMPNRTSSVGNPFLFAGREFDRETGLYYNRARHYDPGLGRFVTADPIGIRGGMNLYSYGNSNPATYVDPLGLLIANPIAGPIPDISGLPIFVHDVPSLPPNCQGHTTTACTVHQLRSDGTRQSSIFVVRSQAQRHGVLTVWAHEFAHAVYWILFGQPSGEPFANAAMNLPGFRDSVRKFLEGNGIYVNGDPTFVQPPRDRGPRRPVLAIRTESKLLARVEVPNPDSLVRANVPIFGIAAGPNFQQYRVEYGKGANPTSWIPISSGTKPELKSGASDVDRSGDQTIKGNLGTWDTGLKSYAYLPSHPADHPVDLRGVYTVRLVVTGRDGSIAEDRVTVKVGEAIPNAWGGVVRSDDAKVSLAIPEQALTDAFRVLSIKRLDENPAEVASGSPLLSAVYEFREPGERFAKPVRLEMAYPESAATAAAISAWDPPSRSWKALPTARDDAGKRLIAEVTSLNGYYALLPRDPGAGSDTAARAKPVLAIRPAGDFVVRDTFEDTLGQWSNRDGEFGAEVALDRGASLDGSGCLKVTARSDLGNFAVTAHRTPFDAREYPVVKFDYRIRPEAKVNFLIKTGGRWYEVRFTDDPKDLAYKRVNIAPIGAIAGAAADDAWHTAEFNLLDMLRTRTGNTLVEEVAMADWDVAGFMKLRHGRTRRGTAFYLDNFSIRREAGAGLRVSADAVTVDHFNQKKDTNDLGGAWSTYSNSAGGAIRPSLVNTGCHGAGHCLHLAYAMPRPGAYAGAATGLQDLDLRSFHGLSIRVRASQPGEDFVIGLKDRKGAEAKVAASRFLGGTVPTGWTMLEIPLTAFAGISDWGHMENLSLSFESRSSSKGELLVDDIEFRRVLAAFAVEDFEAGEGVNAMGRSSRTFLNGAVAISGGYAHASPNRIYRLSFGGNIGEQRDYAGSVLGYAGWTTALGGINCSQCRTVSFLIRGAEGGEKPNIYLDDGNHRWGVDIEKYAPVTTSWNRVSIPLKDFAEYGVDLTHLSELQVVFEWERMSGTVYLDDIRFGPAAAAAGR